MSSLRSVVAGMRRSALRLPSRGALACALLGALLLAGALLPLHGPALANAAEGAPAVAAFDAAPPSPELELEAEALAQRWAPSFAQHVSGEHPERDLPLRIDFDGDWRATNNWEHLSSALRTSKPSVYYSAILSATHAYLTYTLFYPRDWSSPACLPYVCHDNDLEVLLLVLTRSSDPKLAQVVLLETKAHNSYLALSGGELARDAARRPLVEVESQGHGMIPVKVGQRLPADVVWLRSESCGSDRQAGGRCYELLPLRETLWRHRAVPAAGGELWTRGETGFLGYQGARAGRLGLALGASMHGSVYAGGVRPPWGLQASSGARGDWFLDPAYVASARHGAWLGAGASLRYVLNPYLYDLNRECSAAQCPSIPPPPAGRSLPLGAAGGALLGVGLLSLSARRPARARS